MVNRLADATSPYLQQHKDNPVDWWPWCDEAWEEARRRDVPVLVSVGYAACHWCHVMAHESFEDDTVAAYLNDHFVSIKVDREERPDVDAAYMEATQALTGQGGWPMTVFCTPTGEPFYAGTYFPPRPVHGLPSFTQLLVSVEETWRTRRGEVDGAAARIAASLGTGRLQGVGGGTAVGPDELAAAVEQLRADFDDVDAGFGSAPKFPPTTVLEFLLRHAARTGSSDAVAMVRATCERMARGGMYDQLGGGFARYSVDRAWVVPHFEKMLYDNALLLRVYLHWWRLERAPLAERVVRETAEFLLRDLRTPEGGFAASLDADTVVDGPHGPRGVEGATYVWSPRQLAEVLGEDDGAWSAALLEVTEVGTFEHGTSTLQMRRDPDDPERWARVRGRLLDARQGRPQPGRDDKVVAAWNGLAVAALAEAGALLDEPSWVEAAATAADLLVSVHFDGDGELRRTSRDGRAGDAPGVLEDYADVADGFLALHAVTADPAWLALAGGLVDVVLARFADADGSLADVAPQGADPRLARLGRRADPTDSPTPSGAAAAAGALLSLSALTGSSRLREAAERAVAPALAVAVRAPRFVGQGLAVAEAMAAGPLEVAVVGPVGDPGREALRRAALASPSPGLVLAVGEPGAPDAAPLLRDRPLMGGMSAAYVCRGFVCRRPVTDVVALETELNAAAT